jgi:Putative Ig domain
METLRSRAPILGAYVLCTLALAAVAGCGGGGSASVQNTTSSPPPGAAAPPTIAGTPATQVTAGQAYSFMPAVTDPSGGALSFSIQNMPSWATFSMATGTLSGTPTSSNVGTFANIVISVSDGKTSAALAPFSIAVAAAPVSGSANLVWVPPTSNTDGTPLTNLAGYTINYGNSAGSMTQTIDVPSAADTGYKVQGLAAGTWYFTVTAYTSVGTRSAPSDVASKTIS